MPPVNTPRKKILVVEDEKDLVQLVKYNLESQGYEVHTIKNAEEGLNLARKLKPDLIVLDLMLPGMDGFEFTKILREETGTPIIFLTASKSDTCRKMAMKLGANDYITKPFSLDMLLDRVQNILSQTSPV